MQFPGSGRGRHPNVDRPNICYFPIRHTFHHLSTRDPTGQKDRIPMHPKQALDLETAFVSRDTPSLADCIIRLRQDETLGRDRKRDLISGLNRLAKAINREPTTVPADPTWLQPRIAAVSPARNGITQKSWSNIISNAQAALRHLGITATRTRDLSDLSEGWRALWQALLSSNDYTLARGLGRFVRFLDKNDVGPNDVIEAHVDLFRKALTLNELRKDPAESALQALYAWNRAVAKIPTWPKTRLAPRAVTATSCCLTMNCPQPLSLRSMRQCIDFPHRIRSILTARAGPCGLRPSHPDAGSFSGSHQPFATRAPRRQRSNILSISSCLRTLIRAFAGCLPVKAMR
jgi:hypothetical protein